MTALTTRKRSRRRGYGLAEIALAIMLLMAAMTLTVQALGLAAAERRSADRRLWAGVAASNVLERATALPFDDVSAAKIKGFTTDAHADRALPEADWQVAVADDAAGALASKRVTVRLRWKQRSGHWESPVRLTAWVFRQSKSKEGRP